MGIVSLFLPEKVAGGKKGGTEAFSVRLQPYNPLKWYFASKLFTAAKHADEELEGKGQQEANHQQDQGGRRGILKIHILVFPLIS